jgi:hypothetical protein
MITAVSEGEGRMGSAGFLAPRATTSLSFSCVTAARELRHRLRRDVTHGDDVL